MNACCPLPHPHSNRARQHPGLSPTVGNAGHGRDVAQTPRSRRGQTPAIPRAGKDAQHSALMLLMRLQRATGNLNCILTQGAHGLVFSFLRETKHVPTTHWYKGTRTFGTFAASLSATALNPTQAKGPPCRKPRQQTAVCPCNIHIPQQ